MSVNSVGGLSVSPYLTSALSRIQANGLAAKNAPQASSSPSNKNGGAEASNETRVLSNQTLGALVAMQMGDDAPPAASNPTEGNSGG